MDTSVMMAIKEANAGMRDKSPETREAMNACVTEQQKSDFMNNYFQTFHEKVKDQCRSLWYFVHLCTLDMQYNFSGGVMVK